MNNVTAYINNKAEWCIDWNSLTYYNKINKIMIWFFAPLFFLTRTGWYILLYCMPVISDDLYNLMLTAGFFADSSKFHLPLDYNADFSHMRCHHTSCVTVFIGLKSFLCKFIGISTWITLTLNLQNVSILKIVDSNSFSLNHMSVSIIALCKI